jgi:hypothetical protein
MQSKATSVSQYLQELPPDRRVSAEAVINVVRANADPLLEEGMQYGMIGWYVPHSVFPPGYHADPKQPLPYACLASQKNHLSLYLMSVYADDTPDEQWFRTRWAASGKKLDMGKSCIRFKKADDLALDVIAEALQRVGVARHIAAYSKHDPRNRAAGAKNAGVKTEGKVVKKAVRKAVKKVATTRSKPAPKK